MIRIAGSYLGFAEAFRAVVDHYGWTHVVLVSDVATLHYCWFGCTAIDAVFSSNPNYTYSWLRLSYTYSWLRPNYAYSWLRLNYTYSWLRPNYTYWWLRPNYAYSWLRLNYTYSWLKLNYMHSWLRLNYTYSWLRLSSEPTDEQLDDILEEIRSTTRGRRSRFVHSQMPF